MTCIVGIRSQNRVVLAGDSAVIADDLVTQAARPKVFRRGAWVLGYAGTLAAGQAVELGLKAPRLRATDDVAQVVTARLAPAIRRCLEAAGLWVEQPGGRPEFIVGARGRLFRLDEDLDAVEVGEWFSALGVADKFALGALHAIEEAGPADPGAAALRALRAAARFSASVRPPFHVVEVG